MPANPTPAEGVVVPFVSPTCGGERCFCGAAAVRKVGEEIPRDDPSYRRRHNLTAYVCAEHFAMILGPAAARSVGHALHPAAPTDEVGKS